MLENGQLEEAVIMQNYLRLLRASDASTHSQFINLAIKTGELSPSQLEQEATLWKQRFIPSGQSYAIKALNNPKTATMGFLLGELPSAWLDQIITPLINALAESGDKIFVYTTKHNSSLNRFNSAVTHVPSIALSGDSFIAHVRRDGIEILVDVCGFNIGQRQIALGLQIASKQFGWLAHPGYYASGLIQIMDKNSDSLPIFIQLNKSPADSPSNLLPNNTLAAIGCKQGLSNIVMRTWVEVLKRQNNLKLQLDTSEPSIIKNLTNRFVDLGVDQERLLFTGDLQFNHETVVVDNFMQNNIIEVAQAANSGACVIALDGELFQGTLSARMLKQLGRPEWVSYDRINYVAKIIQQLNEQSRNPITVAEIKTSRLEDLDGFVEQFRTILLA